MERSKDVNTDQLDETSTELILAVNLTIRYFTDSGMSVIAESIIPFAS